MVFRRLAGGAGIRLRPPTRSFLAILAGVALVCGLLGAAQARQSARALDHQAVVLNGHIVGSAFLIGTDIAVTNAHVVKGVRAGGVVTLMARPGRAAASARLIAVSPVMDLAVLRTPAGYAPAVSASDAPPRAGLAVRGAGIDASGGRVLGPRLELTGAIVSPRTDLGAFGPGLVVSMPGVRPGFSGGPVLDGQGRLVGMITAIRSGDGGARGASGSGFAPAQRRAPDEAFVLRADAIRTEASRLLRLAAE